MTSSALGCGIRMWKTLANRSSCEPVQTQGEQIKVLNRFKIKNALRGARTHAFTQQGGVLTTAPRRGSFIVPWVSNVYSCISLFEPVVNRFMNLNRFKVLNWLSTQLVLWDQLRNQGYLRGIASMEGCMFPNSYQFI